jgi:Sigma-70, region 4
MLERRRRGPITSVDAHLEPYPHALGAALAQEADGPSAATERREAIGRAFVAAMQLLAPKQRVVLVLRHVLDWSAREVADALDDSVSAVNSALQRARERIARERAEGCLGREHGPADVRADAAVMRRFQDAWDAVDIEAIVALLADDALLRIPPEDSSIPGAAAIRPLLHDGADGRPLGPHPPARDAGERPARARHLRRGGGLGAPRRLRDHGLLDTRRADRGDHWCPGSPGPLRAPRPSGRAAAARCAVDEPAVERRRFQRR